MHEYLVSIHCITYNHEDYIADAIESFLFQRTNFKFEIIIHDDASSDRTPEIIREYEKKYPKLIKPIYQSINQFSQGKALETILIEKTQGKYIALCEGDDYWIDPLKLQKQIDFMEENIEFSLCVHAANKENAKKNKITSQIRPNIGNKIFTTEEVIEGGGGLFPTNSMFFPANLAKIRPKFFELATIGDYPLVISLSLLGKVFYMDEVMSTYRVEVPGSWTVETLSNIDKQEKHYDQLVLMLEELNQYTKYKYDKVITKTKRRHQFYQLIEQRKFKEIKRKEFNEIFQDLSIKRKFIIMMREYFPKVFTLLKFVKRKLTYWSIR